MSTAVASEAAARPLNVVVFVGSLRKGSYNAAIARALPALAPEGLTFTILEGLGDLPHYDADLQAQGFPPKVLELAQAVSAADAVAFVTPEYNYSIPGFLKNAIDWLSRVSPAPFAGKPALIQSASMGVLGGVRAQYHLRQILVFLDAIPLNKPEVIIGAVHSKIDAAGELTDQPTRDFIATQLTNFAAFIRRLQP
ncbi:NADPH-dependent FMN reductase [Pseudoxanthobacter sp.]|uniref:NADPH-dependent FMN reductase n=1 Tax=Pseudoxanthobacter sp. TaxID=1925742 RepID=UPI002FE33402